LYCENLFTPVPPEAEIYKSFKMTTRKVITTVIMLPALVLLMTGIGCNKDEDPPPRQTSYNLTVKDVLGVTGTATFIETSSTVTTIEITLNGAPVGTHPAELCMNSIVEGGPVVATLNPVDVNGNSSTNITTMTYTELLAYSGFIRVLKSSSELDVILAQGDIGGNVMTSTNATYALETVGTFLVSGTALFEKRVNGNTLVTITVTGVINGETYPASINIGSIASVGGGPVVKTMNSVDGTTGTSYTNIQELNDGTDITYDNWMEYLGYINIYQGTVDIDHIICHGNIGSN